jgi:hypothetical protein
MVAWVPAAIAAGSALIQWLNSREAQKASEEERKRVEELLAKIEDPNFDTSTITPEEYKIVQRYVPEVASYVEEEAPETVKLASEDAKLGRKAMKDGLAALQRAATDATERNISIAEALDAARMESGARDASVKQDFAARGQTGSGMEMASRLMGAQQGGKTAADVTRTATRDAYREGLQNLMRAASLGGDIESRELDVERGNAGIINQWNQRRAAGRNEFNRYAADTVSSANRFNTGMANDVDAKNVSGRNQAKEEGRDTRNWAGQQGFSNDMTRAGRAVDTANMARGDIRNRAIQTNDAVSGVAQAGQVAYDQYGRDDRGSYPKPEREPNWQDEDEYRRRNGMGR